MEAVGADGDAAEDVELLDSCFNGSGKWRETVDQQRRPLIG
jgi:hypothetical protein